MACTGLLKMRIGAATTQSPPPRHTALAHIRRPGVHIGAGASEQLLPARSSSGARPAKGSRYTVGGAPPAACSQVPLSTAPPGGWLPFSGGLPMSLRAQRESKPSPDFLLRIALASWVCCGIFCLRPAATTGTRAIGTSQTSSTEDVEPRACLSIKLYGRAVHVSEETDACHLTPCGVSTCSLCAIS